MSGPIGGDKERIRQLEEKIELWRRLIAEHDDLADELSHLDWKIDEVLNPRIEELEEENKELVEAYERIASVARDLLGMYGDGPGSEQEYRSLKRRVEGASK